MFGSADKVTCSHASLGEDKLNSSALVQRVWLFYSQVPGFAARRQKQPR